MPKFDVRCKEEGCGHEWEASKAFDEEAQCPVCYSSNTVTLMPRMQRNKAKDPYDMLNGHTGIPDPKKIKSFANDRRKGGKDTS